jgi:hypothetical protein
VKLVKIAPRLFEEVSLPSGAEPLNIEIAADDEIDAGIMDDENYRRFADADSDKGIKKAKWFEQVKSKKFVFQPPSTDSFYWLILWNAYSNKPVSVAYAITST